ncbi:MAG TPA: TIR domain-containing protein, partial [Ktedonobacteraceae bacterium]|nr:TIR domain-containing protein [Ktedonobacteraceae bacterium]
MSQEDTQESRQPLHFFISYTSSDLPWAEWIAMQLEQAGYTVVIQAWDFRPGSNFVAEMDRAAKRAERTLLVLSPAYLRSDLAFSAWAAAFSQDPGGTQGRVLPVRIEPCDVPGLLRQVVSIDLVSLDEAQARERLLEGVKKGRAKPATAGFPGRHVPILPASAPFPGSLPPIWNIPFARNPFFTGQEHVLARLSEALHPGETDAHGYPRIALSGLGGIGKTQLAVEYAYRHRSAYDAILWVNANTTENLMRSYSELARLLKLPDCDAQEQERVVQAVKDWLRKERNYLLILDNADTPSFLRQFMPQDAGGHLLITTCVATITEAGLGLAAPLALEALDPETGAQLLLRRANLLTTATPPDQELACLLSIELGGLPLALDQAGAYIASKPTSLARYQQLYQQHHLKLLRKRNNEIEHPEPVVTTWDISFRAVEETDPAAANLLRFCAFLAPSGIPEYILIAGTEGLAPMFADELLLDEAIGVLRSYSLIERDSESGMIHMHRLVQEVVRERMEEKEQVKWTARAMEAVLMVYPDDPDVANWPRQEQLLPHALQCALFAEVLNLAVVAVHLLNRMGKYLFSRARYEEAEPLLAHALAATEQGWEAEHAIRTACMNDLALLYVYQGRYEEAE